MKTKKGSFRKKLRQAFSAFAYEHSGEMLSVKRKGQVLSDTPVSDANGKYQSLSTDNQPSTRRILMSIDKVVDPELLKYTVDAAKQFNASIDILSQQNYDELYRIMENEMHDFSVHWRLIKLEKDVLSGISDYVSNHSDVLFMVSNQQKIFSDHSVRSRYAA